MILTRFAKHDFRYTEMISDGDSKAYTAVMEDKPYGEVEQIRKIDWSCIKKNGEKAYELEDKCQRRIKQWKNYRRQRATNRSDDKEDPAILRPCDQAEYHKK